MKTRPTASSFFLLTLLLLLGPGRPDPDPLQDYCVADLKTPPPFFINGAPCIDPERVAASHFATSVLSKPGNTSGNPFGLNITVVNIRHMPGLNTMGLTMARLDIAPGGSVPLHWHPRASEVVILLSGYLLVGFVDTSNVMFSQRLRPGDAFVFPKGLVHFMFNVGEKNSPVVALAGLNSQNPGREGVSTSSFVTRPEIPDEVLKATFQIGGQDVSRIRRNLGG
ncbi:germin-like protein subfamily 1 member 1 [Malania oleifera]|uniref:germin-like protein subfamily 1 member 1 n=1 Tax=Malania oleifera TaxID=397392 RepID=UPI0025ADF7E1|nr:germin-like protein subfamily 1 member 1 [Malania oleifera]